MSSFFCESSESPTRKNKNVHTFSVYLLLPSKKVSKEKSMFCPKTYFEFSRQRSFKSKINVSVKDNNIFILRRH